MDKTKVLVIAIGIIMVVTFICVYFFKTRAEEELRWKNQEVNQDQEDCIVELTYKENGNLVEDFTIEPEPAIDPAPTIEPEPAIEPEQELVTEEPAIDPAPEPIIEPDPEPAIKPEPAVDPAPEGWERTKGFLIPIRTECHHIRSLCAGVYTPTNTPDHWEMGFRFSAQIMIASPTYERDMEQLFIILEDFAGRKVAEQVIAYLRKKGTTRKMLPEKRFEFGDYVVIASGISPISKSVFIKLAN